MEEKVYTPNEVKIMLGLSKSATQRYLVKVMQTGYPFRVLRLGKKQLIVKNSFDEWLDGKSSEKPITIACRVYTADEIGKMLRLGKSSTYEYLSKVMEEGRPFRVVRRMQDYLINKESFDNWIEGNN